MGGAAAEEASVFGLAPVAPDRTAAYGEHPDQVVDFYLPPDGSGPAPLVLLFHGGAWRAPYDRRHVSPFAAFLAGRGLAVASVEYRRGRDDSSPYGPAAPEVPGGGPGGPRPGPDGTGEAPRAGRWPETFDDIAAAVDGVPRLVRDLGLPGADTGRVVLTGHSAGGHAVLWAAARHRLPSGTPWYLPSPSPLCGAVALAPIADFATARALDVCSGAVGQLLGERGGKSDSAGGNISGSRVSGVNSDRRVNSHSDDGANGHSCNTSHSGGNRSSDRGANSGSHGRARTDELTARLALADPAALLPTAVPTTVVQGRADTDVPPAVADAFVTAASRVGQRVRLVTTEGGHFPLIDPTTPVAHTVAEEIARLAGAHPGA
ncbi:alpha/beta hydrolase [Streptomyces hygroscopicus]|uniref:alpha/beta hydrolase n=1 Tax=Streptomyces hygroscopicus TaxID=1912 RepID=UPI000785E214|nr:alpha/beta hydrolase [Streptomyces hygroscopicus]